MGLKRTVTLADSGNSIRLGWGDTPDYQFITKNYSVTPVDMSGTGADSDYVIIQSEITTQVAQIAVGDITAPVVANLAALVTLLEGWNDTSTTSSSMTTIEGLISSLEGGYSTLVGKTANPPVNNTTFTAVYQAATGITISNLPTWHTLAEFTAQDIEKIDRYDTAGIFVASYNRQDTLITYANPIITVTGVTFTNTDTFVVYTNVTTVASPYYAEDSVHASGDIGMQILAVRDDTPSGLAADGDYIPLTTDDKGYLWTHEINSQAMVTSLSLLDDCVFVDDTATHTTGATKGLGIMGVAVPTDISLDANDIGMFAMSLKREMYTVDTGLATLLAFGTGAMVASQSVTIATDDTIMLAQAAILTTIDTDTGNIATSTATIATAVYAEDAGHTTADAGIQILGVRNDNGAAFSGTDLDYTPIATKSNGYVKNANYDDTEQAGRIIEQSPEHNHRVTETYSVTYAQATGAGQVYWLIPMDTYKNGSIYVKVVGDAATDDTTIKVWSTNDPDITTAVTQALLTSENWDDVTNDLTGAASHNPTGDTTATGGDKYTWYLDTPIVCEYLVVEFDVTVIAGTDINFTGFAKLT